MMLLVAVVAGVLFGSGVVLAVYGVRPPLARLDRRVALVLSEGAGSPATQPAWWRWRDQAIARLPRSVMPDLALLGRTSVDFVTFRLVWAAGGAFGVALVSSLLGVPPPLVALFAVSGAAGGWYLALHELQDAAAKRRRTMGLALAAWTQMVAMMIRAGLGVEQAMREAATAGRHWTFDALQRAMDRAVDDRQPIWQRLAALGEETEVVELRQLASELKLTDTVGGTPTEALLTRARVLREEELAGQLAAAKAAEVKQAVPLGLLGICLTGFVVYPAVQSFLGT